MNDMETLARMGEVLNQKSAVMSKELDELSAAIDRVLSERDRYKADADRLAERVDNLRESLVIADARMTKQLSGKLMSVTLIAYLNQIQQDMRLALKADQARSALAAHEEGKNVDTI